MRLKTVPYSSSFHFLLRAAVRWRRSFIRFGLHSTAQFQETVQRRGVKRRSHDGIIRAYYCDDRPDVHLRWPLVFLPVPKALALGPGPAWKASCPPSVSAACCWSAFLRTKMLLFPVSSAIGPPRNQDFAVVSLLLQLIMRSCACRSRRPQDYDLHKLERPLLIRTRIVA